MTKHKNFLADLERIYNKASGTWEDADWPHLDTSRERCCEHDMLDCGSEDCVGLCGACSVCASEGPHVGCETCENATSDAAAAEEAAEHAMEAAREHMWGEALEAAEEAVRLENEYGDALTWRPLQKEIEWLKARSLVGHVIVLDATFDASQTNLCTCDACLAGYRKQYEEVVAEIAEEESLDICVVHGSYQCPEPDESCERECKGECEGLWQEAHDRTNWQEASNCEFRACNDQASTS